MSKPRVWTDRGRGQFNVPPPPPRFPETDPLWFKFVAWVLTGGVVRRTLLEEAKNGAWEIVWAIFKAGAEHSNV